MILQDDSAVAVHTVSATEVCIDFIAPRTSHDKLEFMRVTLDKVQLHELVEELLKHSKGIKYVQQ